MRGRRRRSWGRTKRRYMKRRYGRRMNRRRLPSRMPVSDNKMSRTVKLRYCVNTAVAAGPPGVMTILDRYRANSIWDPNFEVGGNTVLDHTRWASLYNHYTVMGSKITYTISPVDAITGMVFLTKLDDDGTAFIASNLYTGWAGDPRVKMKAFNLTSYTSQAQFKFSRTFSARKFFNLKNPADVDSVSAQMGANPADQAFYCAAVQAANLGDATPRFTLTVNIDYLVRFSEPKDIYNVL